MAIWKILSIGAVIITLGACRGYYVAPGSLAEKCPQCYKHYNLTLCWNTERSTDRLTITGYALNTRYYYMKGLEVTATLLDEQGKPLGEATDFIIPDLIPMDESAPFTLTIPLRSGEKPAVIRFFYRYRLTRLDDDGTPYFHSFTVELR